MAEKESTSETVLQVNSFTGGYHEYQGIWTPEIGDEYELRREPLYTVDDNTVAIHGKEKDDGCTFYHNTLRTILHVSLLHT